MLVKRFNKVRIKSRLIKKRRVIQNLNNGWSVGVTKLNRMDLSGAELILYSSDSWTMVLVSSFFHIKLIPIPGKG